MIDVHRGNQVFHQAGNRGGHMNQNKQPRVCHRWRQGLCNRFPCPYLHSEIPPEKPAQHGGDRKHCNGSGNVKKTERVCNHWVRGTCKFGENCKFLHEWSTGDSFKLLTKLEGHQQVVTGIALPSGSDKLYTGSKDKTVKVWDCNSGKCEGTLDLGGPVGCMIGEGQWVFVGLKNLVKVWNFETKSDFELPVRAGQIYAFVLSDNFLFSGAQDGTIHAWRFNAAANGFEPAATLDGHKAGVVSLIIGANKLYSGSMDGSIKQWSLETLQCIQTLKGHSDVVMSLLCWDQYLLSGSLDGTLKVWAADEKNELKEIYEHDEKYGVLAMCGTYDPDNNPVLLCSCNNNSIRVYDLPSFIERGKIFSEKEIRVIQALPGGLVVTGDGAQQVKSMEVVER